MKKQKFFSVLALAGMLFATSCSQDEIVNDAANGDYVNATFTLNTADGIASRATIGDGTTVDKVACSVYDANGKELGLYEIVNVNDKTATYDVRLAKGQAYRVAFFAYNEAANAYNVEDLTNIVVNDGQKSNLEGRDAFTAYFDVTADMTMTAINETVELYRPFAQLNLGIDKTELDDAAKAGIVVKESYIKVSNVHKAFNAYNDAVVATDVAEPMEFDLNTIPQEALSVDVNRDGVIDEATEKFTYLALNYLLVGDKKSEKSLTDVEFVWATEDGKTNSPATNFINIPVQRNYRTNIIGKLLTNPATFNIVIEEGFENSPAGDYIVSLWDGESTTTPEADADGIIRISSAAEFVGLMATTGNSIYYGKTIELQCNIDLGNYTVKGIGSGNANFAGVFDGKGYTISNFTVDATDRTYYAGLFNQVSHGGTIKNLTVKGATVKGNSMVGAVASSVDGGVVENCKAINCTLIGAKKVGSVVGYSAGGTVKDCYAENCVIEYSEKEAGEVLGFENTGSTVSNNTYKDITFKASAAALAKEMTPVNGVITLTRDYTVTGDWTPLKFSGTITINGNDCTISNLNRPLLAGNAASTLTVNDLTIAGSNIDGTNGKYYENGLGTGAFIGWIDSQSSVAFNNCHLKNSTVTGNERAAGLIAYSTATNSVSINGCSINGCTIKAVGGTAGLIAYSLTATEIANSSVLNSTVESTEDRTGKTALAGAIIGTVAGNTTLTNVSAENTTATNNGAEAYSLLVGRIVSGELTVN